MSLNGVLSSSLSVKKEALIKEEGEQSMTEEDVHQYLFFQAHNKKQSDGRINAGYQEDGQLKAISVSPRFKYFEGQVEPLIYPSVKILVNKGYMTISSCDGHPRRAMIKIGFGNKGSRARFIDELSLQKVPMIKFVEHEDCINMKMELIEKEKARSSRVEDHEKNKDIDKANAKAFNFQFKRNYEKWYFLDIIILTHQPQNLAEYLKVSWALRRKKEILITLSKALEKVSIYERLYREGNVSVDL